MKNKIPRILKIDKQVFGSLRGNYQLVKNFKFVKFSVTKLNKEFKKWKNTSNFFQLVHQEIKALEDLPNSLYEHPFWKQEETYLLDSYTSASPEYGSYTMFADLHIDHIGAESLNISDYRRELNLSEA
ncbi:MAG: hypothetical protein IKJ03_00395, partial [Mycoplasmataceae bacterium]|nr:hypothetical protein [Mycoplasmataceae bacterium]